MLNSEGDRQKDSANCEQSMKFGTQVPEDIWKTNQMGHKSVNDFFPFFEPHLGISVFCTEMIYENTTFSTLNRQ